MRPFSPVPSPFVKQTSQILTEREVEYAAGLIVAGFLEVLIRSGLSPDGTIRGAHRPMLVLFDVDGTLTSTTGCDLKCFKEAMEHVFGVPLPSDDWDDYEHVTDTGIISEVIASAEGREVSREEFERFESSFKESLHREYTTNPGAFGEIRGAGAVLRHLLRQGVAVALASGGMRKTAHFKLSCAGIDGEAYQGAFANDALTREGIALCAMERSGASRTDVVYVGDGLWDVRTSRALGMRFVGITSESSERRLREAGATVCLHDYSDLAQVMNAFETADVPRPVDGL